MKCKVQQSGIEDQISPAYFNISLQEWKRLQGPIREKIEALVRRALNVEAEETSKEVEAHVSKFLKKSGKPGTSKASKTSSRASI